MFIKMAQDNTRWVKVQAFRALLAAGRDDILQNMQRNFASVTCIYLVR